MTSTRCITLLPVEIKLEILTYLTTADKSRLLRVCKSLHDVVESALYESIYLHGMSRPSFTLPMLLDRFLTYPGKAASVRKVQFSNLCGSHMWRGIKSSGYRRPEIASLDPVAQSKAKRLVQTLALPQPSISNVEVSHDEAWEDGIHDWECDDNDEGPWASAIHSGDVDAFQALIFSQLTNLETLVVDQFNFVNFPFLSIVITNATSTSKSNQFRNLRSVKLLIPSEHYDRPRALTSPNRRASGVLSFLYLPSLTNFQLMMKHDHGYFDWAGKAPVAKVLATLRLRKSHLKPHLLGRLLTLTSSLRHLEYEFYCSTRVCPNRPICLNCEELEDAIAVVGTTLEVLHISVCLYQFHDNWHEDPDSSLGIKGILNRLRDLKRLRKLHVPLILLLSAHPEQAPALMDQLPTSIRALSTSNDQEAFHTTAKRKAIYLRRLKEYVLAHEDSYASQLQSLELVIRSPLGIWNDPAQFELRRECERLGICYRIRRYDTGI